MSRAGFLVFYEGRENTTDNIFLISPTRTGKSTLGKLLAGYLQILQVSLDDLRRKYYKEIGYDEELAKYIVYTKGKTPEDSRDGILRLIAS